MKEADLYELAGPARDAVLDAMVSGDDRFPIAFVGEVMACAGELDVEAIVEAALGLRL